MTTFTATGIRAIPCRGRSGRREVAIHRIDRVVASPVGRTPWLVVTLGVALMALALFNLIVLLADLA